MNSAQRLFVVILFTWCLIPLVVSEPPNSETQFYMFSTLQLLKGSQNLHSTCTSWSKFQGMTSKIGCRFSQMPCTLLEPPPWRELPQRKERRRKAHCRRCVMFSQRCNIHWRLVTFKLFRLEKTDTKKYLFSSVLKGATDLQSTGHLGGPRYAICFFFFFEAAHLGCISKFQPVEWLKISGPNISPKSFDFPLNMLSGGQGSNGF